MTTRRIVLIGNYRPDRQQSMNSFALMLQSALTRHGIDSEIWYPKVVFASGMATTTYGLGKWLGYLDKWLVFPLLLWLRRITALVSRTNYSFHICDHSNAPYLASLPLDKTVITCHDVLAIRGALGYTDAYCPASPTGKIYQKWILKHLSRSRKIASVTQATLEQLRALSPPEVHANKDWRTVHNAFNAPFSPLSLPEAQRLTLAAGLPTDKPFILHVGSNLPRKNRVMLLDMVAQLGDAWSGYICYAGEAAAAPLLEHAQQLGLTDRLISIARPDHLTLRALYSTCQALVFPSFSEGFGWPVIEAQACDAPVIASKLAPMPEVSGGAALLADPAHPQEFADALLALTDGALRTTLIQQGRTNCSRFTDESMVNAYLNLHQYC